MLVTPNLAFPLQHEETATSYVSRLSKYAGAPTPFDLCNDLGLEWQSIVRGEDIQLRALAALGGANAVDMMRWSIRRQDGLNFQIGNEVVPNKTLLRSRIRLCPICIQEDDDRAYRRFHWNLRSIRTCATHHVPLIQLPHLEHTFGNYDFIKRVEACRTEIEAAAMTGPMRQFTAFESYLLDRLRGSALSCAFADSLSVATLTRLTEALGLTLLGYHGKLSATPDDTLHSAGQAGFAYLERGEHGLIEAMRDLHVDPLQSNASHKIDFGAFWVWLCNARSTPEIERIRSIARNYVFENYPIQRGTEVLGEECPRTRIYSVNSAKIEHGISRKRLVRCLVDDGVARPAPYNPEGLELLRQITEKDIQRIVSHREGFVHRKEAAAMLGTTDKAFRQLRQRGIIEQHSDAVDKRPMFDPAEVTSYLANVFASIRPSCSPNASRFSLPTACQKLGTSLIGAVDLIVEQKVATARLQPNGVGLDRIVVCPEELRDAIIADMVPAMPKLKAAQFLATSLRTVDYLIQTERLSLIKRGRSLKGFDFPAVSETSIQAFLKDFTTVGRLARGMGLNFMFVMHGLEKSGVDAEIVPKGIGRVYRRDKVIERKAQLTFDIPKKVDWHRV